MAVPAWTPFLGFCETSNDLGQLISETNSAGEWTYRYNEPGNLEALTPFALASSVETGGSPCRLA